MNHIQTRSEKDILNEIKLNNPETFRYLFDTYWEKLYQIAYQKIRSEDDAKDIVQNVFISFWQKRHAIDIRTSLEAYLSSAVRYEVLSFISASIKKKERESSVVQTILPAFTNVNDTLQIKELHRHIALLIDRLPGKMKQVYLMSRNEDLSVKEISEHLSLSEQTVRNQLNTAVTKIKSGLVEFVVFFLIFQQV